MNEKLTKLQKAGLQAISQARFIQRRLAPYFTHAMGQMTFAPEVGLGTMGVTKKGLIYFDPTLLVSQNGEDPRWSPEETAGVLVHELMHRLSRHAERAEAFGVRRDEHRIWNECCDAEINHKLRGQFELPEGGYYPEMIYERVEGNLQAKVVWDDYWNELHVEGGDTTLLLAETMFAACRAKNVETLDPPPNVPVNVGAGDGDDASGGGSESDCASDSTEDGEEQSDGTGTGDSNEGDGDSISDGSGSEAGEGDGDSGTSSGNGQGNEPPTPEPWGNCGSGAGAGCEQVDEDELERKWLPDGAGLQDHHMDEIIEKTARDIIEDASTATGSGNGGMRRWADEIAARAARIPWHVLLRRKCASLLQAAGGSSDYSYRRFSRRQAAAGFGLGTPRYPSIRGVKPTIGVALDMSGSISDEMLDQMLLQVKAISRQLGTKVHLCAWDDTVKGDLLTRDPTSTKARALFANGGGGTSVGPVFDLYNENRNQPDVLVIFTDGYIWDCPTRPPAYPVVWALIGDCGPSYPKRSDYGTVTYGDRVDVRLTL